jgi:predicted permease
MAQFIEQLQHTLRRLLRAPLFAGVTVLTLAIAIGANTVVFSVVEGVLLKPLDYPHSDRLVGLWYKAPGVNLPELDMAPFLYFIDREQNTSFQDIGVYDNDSLSVTGIGQPEHVAGIDVTDGTLPLLGAQPALGRLFTRQDDTANTPKTVVLSYGYWQRRLGGSVSALGRSVTIDGMAHEIIGVLPRNFQFLDNTDAELFLPMQFDRSKTKLGNFSYRGIARLKPGVTIEQAGTDMARLLPIAIHSFPAPQGYSTAVFEKAQIQPNLRTLKKDVVGDVGNVLWVLMGSIAVVLLVASANVANLLLVRVEGRRQELAIRSALGAGRGNIAAAIFLESLVLGIVGSVIGLGLAFGALRILAAAAPTGLPRLHEIGFDLPVLLFTLGITLLVSLAIGTIPVLKYTSVRASTGLREGGRSLSQSRERHRTRQALVVIQVSLALVLLICSGLMIRTFRALVHVSPGFADPASLQTFRIYIPETQIPETQNERVIRMEQAIRDKIAVIPGVSSVVIGSAVPMDANRSFNPVAAEDHVYKEGELPPLRRFKYVSPAFFSTLGTPLVAGRDFTWDETYQKRPVAILSENTAREYWGSAAAALGKHVRVATTDDWREVVGVAADIYDDGVSQKPPTSMYWPLLLGRFDGQSEEVRRGVGYIIRSPRAGSAAFMSEVERAVWSVDPDLPLANPTTVGLLYTKSMARTSFTLVMLCVAGGMALLLGIVGIYGVISYAVAQRTREIGIRLALGSPQQAVTSLFVRQGLWLSAIGVAIGLVVAFFTMKAVSTLLFNVSPADPWTYAVMTACILAVSGIACYVPSRRAAGVDPMHSLRSE